ncbi:WD_REPEATS_REGION domain-containing protein [Durusdinium trenchii]|uniref:WD_REPEATS_REGION domain-containing protein n=1 Tax=Durusdinium trenchii TaxID=1381693 RepID=A0ABP0QAZ8_9DINO
MRLMNAFSTLQKPGSDIHWLEDMVVIVLKAEKLWQKLGTRRVLSQVSLASGHGALGLQELQRALGRPGVDDGEEGRQLWSLLGRHHLSWGNLPAAKDAFENARSCVGEAPGGESTLLLNQGLLAMASSDYSAARNAFEAAAVATAALEEEVLAAENNLAVCKFYTKDLSMCGSGQDWDTWAARACCSDLRKSQVPDTGEGLLNTLGPPEALVKKEPVRFLKPSILHNLASFYEFSQDASGKRRQLHMLAATTQLLCFERFSCRYSFVICFPLAIDAGKHEDTDGERGGKQHLVKKRKKGAQMGVSAQERARRERIDDHWRDGNAKAQPAAIIQNDWVRRVALAGDEVFVGTSSTGVRRHSFGSVEPKQVYGVHGNPQRMVTADHPAKVDPETSVTSLTWTGQHLCAGLAGGRLQVWNEEGWLILDHEVNSRPCYVCVYDSSILVAAAGDSIMAWDLNDLGDAAPRCRITMSCRVHCLNLAFEGSVALGLADGSLELRSLPDLSLLSRRILGPVPVSAVYVDERGIVSGDDAGQVVCWDADAQMPGEEWQIKWRGQHQGRIVALNRGGGDSIISAGLDGHIMARKAETGEHMFSIPNHKVWLGSMCVSEELDLLVTDGRDNAVYLYDFGNP